MRKVKILVGVAVSAALAFSATGMAMQSIDERENIIKFGITETKLSQSLSENYKMEYFTAYGMQESKEQIKANVAAAEFVYINLEDFYGEEPELNEYLAEAVKQEKLVVLENGQFWNQVSLEKIPYVSSAEITLFKAGYYTNANKAVLYGSTTSTKRPLIEQQVLDVSVDKKEAEMTSQSYHVKPAKIVSSQLSTMEGEALSQALGKVKATIAELKADSPPVVMSNNLKYQDCPAEAVTERLCIQSLTTLATFEVDWGAETEWEGKLTIISNQVFTGLYRLAENTWAVIIPFGNVSSNLAKDHKQERGWFLDKQVVDLDIAAIGENKLFLESQKPEPVNQVGTITSTSGFTYGITVSTPDKPNGDPWLKGGITYQKGNQTSYQLYDWKILTNQISTNVFRWESQLSKYSNLQDWVLRTIGWPHGFKEVPDISKSRLPYSGELVLYGKNTLEDIVELNFRTTTTSSRIYWGNWNHPVKENKSRIHPYSISLPFDALKHPREVPQG